MKIEKNYYNIRKELVKSFNANYFYENQIEKYKNERLGIDLYSFGELLYDFFLYKIKEKEEKGIKEQAENPLKFSEIKEIEEVLNLKTCKKLIERDDITFQVPSLQELCSIKICELELDKNVLKNQKIASKAKTMVKAFSKLTQETLQYSQQIKKTDQLKKEKEREDDLKVDSIYDKNNVDGCIEIGSFLPMKPFYLELSKVMYNWMILEKFPIFFPSQNLLNPFEEPDMESATPKLLKLAKNWRISDNLQKFEILSTFFDKIKKKGIFCMLRLRSTFQSVNCFPPSYNELVYSFNKVGFV